MKILPRVGFIFRLTILLILGTLGAAAAEPKANWIRVTTGQVVVLSDASQKDTVEIAVQYSAFRQALASLLADSTHHIPPSTVIVFRRTRDFQRYFKSTDSSSNREIVSVSTEVDGAAVLGQSLGGDRELALRQAFEFETTWGLRQMGYFVPLWAAQGTGKVFSTLVTRHGKSTLGLPQEDEPESWADHDVPWSRFFLVRTDSPEYSDPEKLHTYHSQAWALMHYIWLGKGDGPARFKQLAEKLHTTPGLEAVESVLGIPAQRLTTTLDDRVANSRQTREIAFDEAGLRTQLAVAPASLIEICVQLSNLLYAHGKVPEADAELNQAQSLAGDSPLVIEALARRELRQGQPERAINLYRSAISHGSLNPRAYITSASDRLDRISSGRDVAGAGGIFVAPAIAEIRKALELTPENPLAYRILGRALFLQPVVTEPEIAELNRGVGSGDEGDWIRFYHALLLERLKKTTEYEAALRTLVGAPDAAPSVQQGARDRLEALRFEGIRLQVEVLVKNAQFSQARDVVQQAQSMITGQEPPKTYVRLLEWIDDSEHREATRATNDTWHALTQQLDSLVSAKKFDEARQAIAAVRTKAGSTIPADRFDLLLAKVAEYEDWTTLHTLAQNAQWPEVIDRADKFLSTYPASRYAPAVKQMASQAHRSVP